MKLIVKTALLAFFFAWFSGNGNLSHAINYQKSIPLKVTIEPEKPIIRGAPVALKISYVIDSIEWSRAAETASCALTFINPRDYGDTLSRTVYEMVHDNNFAHSSTIEVNLPDGDTCCLLFHLLSGSCGEFQVYYFVDTGDEYEFYYDFIPLSPEYLSEIQENNVRQGPPDPDTLTELQLETKYEVLLDLKDDTYRSIAERLLGQMPNSSKSDLCPTCYILNVSLRNIYKLADEGLDIPRLDRLFLTCPIRSINKVNQQIGRILRKFPGKEDAIVFDFRDSLVSLAESQFHTRLKQVYHDFDVQEVPYAAN